MPDPTDDAKDFQAEWPSALERLPLPCVTALHPVLWPIEELSARCQRRTQSRSGPGGQHRNRTASGVFLTFDPGLDGIGPITAESTEQRQQGRNRSTAMTRLRFVLAVALRSASPLDASVAEPFCPMEPELDLRRRYNGSPLKMNDENVEKPAVLTLVLNDIWVAGGQPSLAAPGWSVSTSRLVSLLRSHSPAFTLVNRIRHHHSRPPLR